MNGPNLFTHAPKELSQDAVLNWLMAWADPSYKAIDEALHKCGQSFIIDLIKKSYHDPITNIIEVTTGRQRKNIDIFAEVKTEDKNFYIIIEDKTTSVAHSGQLLRYIEQSKSHTINFNYDELICIYLKTGNESNSTLQNVLADGFKIYSREDLNNFFSHYLNIQNNIFCDFKDYIKQLHNSFEEYKSLTIAEWRHNSSCWQGFYIALSKEIPTLTNWGYVSNAKGGFWYAVIHGYTAADKSFVYLQLEEGRLCFKISIPADLNIDGNKLERQKLRKHWSDKILLAAKSFDLAITRPKKFGLGKHMTLAEIESKDWLGKDSDIVNQENVIIRLNHISDFLQQLIFNPH